MGCWMPTCQIEMSANCIKKTCCSRRRMNIYGGRARTASLHSNARYSISRRNYDRFSKVQNVIQHEHGLWARKDLPGTTVVFVVAAAPTRSLVGGVMPCTFARTAS